MHVEESGDVALRIGGLHVQYVWTLGQRAAINLRQPVRTECKAAARLDVTGDVEKVAGGRGVEAGAKGGKGVGVAELASDGGIAGNAVVVGAAGAGVVSQRRLNLRCRRISQPCRRCTDLRGISPQPVSIDERDV